MSKEIQESLEKLALRPEMVSGQALNPFMDTVTGSRSVMFSNHMAQNLVLNDGEEKILQSGAEAILGRHTHDIRVPADCTVLKIIPRYRKGYDINSIPHNPESCVIYEEAETGRLGYVLVKEHGSHHNYFGYNLKPTDVAEELQPGDSLDKDTVLSEPVSKKPNGGYTFGTNLNACYMSIKDVAEDGFVISDKALQKCGFSMFEKRTVEVGGDFYPLNLYGTKDRVKIMPEIGEKIHDSGAIMVTRRYEEEHTPCLMTAEQLMEWDPYFDIPTFVKGAGGTVVDIVVTHNRRKVNETPAGLSDQLIKYANATERYYNEIINFVTEYVGRNTRTPLRDPHAYTPQMSRLIVEALSVIGRNRYRAKADDLNKLMFTFKGNNISEFKIDFVIRYDVIPDRGFKFTDLHGGKGVVAKILPHHQMPIDSAGNVADIIVDPGSVIGRINPSRLFEQYINSTVTTADQRVKALLNAKKPNYDKAFKEVLEVAKYVSPQFFETLKGLSKTEVEELLQELKTEPLLMFYPVDGKRSHMDLVKTIEKTRLRPPYGPATLRFSPKHTQTESNVRIAPQYFLLLDKIADNWISGSTVKVNHFGVPAPINKDNRNKVPFRAGAVRFMGESEVRVFIADVCTEAVAEMLDRNANLDTHMNLYKNILEAPTPTNIESVVDRDKIPYGQGSSLSVMRHMMLSYGHELVYEPEE